MPVAARRAEEFATNLAQASGPALRGPPTPQSGEGAARARRGSPQPSTFNPQLTVRPDFVFRKQRTVIFVDGCFWHGCPKHATRPANNRVFWRRKLAGNKTRDRVVTRTLRAQGWRVLRIWEHELQRLKSGPNKVVQRIEKHLE